MNAAFCCILISRPQAPATTLDAAAAAAVAYRQGANLHMLVHPLPAANTSAVNGEGSQPLAWTWFNNQAAEELPGLLLDAGLHVYQHAVPVGRLRWEMG
jgi:hypothetical protein